MRSVKVYEEAWPLHTPFVISRGSRNEACVVVVECEEDGVKGVGECTPYPRYGESLASVMAQIMTVVPELQAGLTREALQLRLPAGAARNAIDCALWSLEAANNKNRCLRCWTLRCRNRSSPRKRWSSVNQSKWPPALRRCMPPVQHY